MGDNNAVAGKKTFSIDNSADKLKEYLLVRGYLEPDETAVITQLGGGVSNDVFKVESSRGEVVFKQALAKLRVKDDWFISPERANVEKDCLKLMRRILGSKYAPKVVFEDEANCIFAIEFAPPGAEMWKQKLLRGEVDLNLACEIARLLARLHNETFENEEVIRRFDQQQRFVDCRVDPYFETIARRHPELADHIRQEIDRVLTLRKVLVHADYCPKNILISPGAAKIWLLDAEASHLGDPTFDTGFLFNHILLKAVKVKEATAELLEAFLQMGQSYGQTIKVFPSEWIEEYTCRELGLLLLARVDGKSPVEYLTDDNDKDTVRQAATRIIREQPELYRDLAEILSQEIARRRHGT